MKPESSRVGLDFDPQGGVDDELDVEAFTLPALFESQRYYVAVGNVTPDDLCSRRTEATPKSTKEDQG